jgi:hypothetical protein
MIVWIATLSVLFVVMNTIAVTNAQMMATNASCIAGQIDCAVRQHRSLFVKLLCDTFNL